ncbi:MAG: glycosylhydrolase-like jelly roll fold domain-containing protein, partial [Candidatus Aminicenantales bacterium]
PDPKPGLTHPCGRGRGLFLAEDRDAGPALRAIVAPSVRFAPRPPTVGFVHRRLENKDLYFFLNVGPDAAVFTAEFPGPSRSLEMWDALSGSIRRAADNEARLEIRLAPRESIFVVAGGRTEGALPGPPAVSAPTAERPIETEWRLDFDGPDPPPSARLSTLVSWTELPGGRFFSGAGIYRSRFAWEGAAPARVLLAFDEIRDAAEVRLNGHPLGILFTPRLEIEAAAALRSGANDLEIVVVNLPLNRFLGLPDQDLEPLRARFGNRFGAPEEKKIAGGSAPAGLIGRVRLIVFDRK